MSFLPVWVPKPGYVALDLEAETRQIHGWQLNIAQDRQTRAGSFQDSLVTSGEGQTRENVASRGRRGLRRRVKLKAVAEGSSVGWRAGHAPQPPAAAARDLREDEDARDGDARDNPDAGIGSNRAAASGAARLRRGGHGGARRRTEARV